MRPYSVASGNAGLCGDFNGKEIQKEGLYIYIFVADSLCCTAEINRAL